MQIDWCVFFFNINIEDIIRIKIFPLNITKIILFITEKYDLVGRLLRPGEEPTNYSEEEDEEKDKNALSDKPKEE